MKTFEERDIVSSTVTFQDINWDPVDPATVEFVVELKGQALTTFTYAGASTPAANVVARTNEGEYTFWFDTTGGPGLYTMQASGTGQGQAATPKTYFQVTPYLEAAA